MPFYNVSQGVRVIAFGTENKCTCFSSVGMQNYLTAYSQVGLYFGILIAWTAVSVITLPLSIILVRWIRARRAAKAQAQVQVLLKEADTEAGKA
jgi:hypothetical protein